MNTQNPLYTHGPGFSMGRGEKGEKPITTPYFTPGPGNYDHDEFHHHLVPPGDPYKKYEPTISMKPPPTKELGPGAHEIKSKIGAEGPKYSFGPKFEKRRKEEEDKRKKKLHKDALGPGTHKPKLIQTAPTFSFGYQFRNALDEGIIPAKTSAAGPGSYEIKNTIGSSTGIRFARKPKAEQSLEDERKKEQIRRNRAHQPGPADYRPNINYNSISYSLRPKTKILEEVKSTDVPGAGAYSPERNGTFGGSGLYYSISVAKDVTNAIGMDNKVPGPGSYHPNPIEYPRATKIVPHEKEVEDAATKAGALPGPGSFEPFNPNFVSSKYKFGTGTRQPLHQTMVTPAPHDYGEAKKLDTGSKFSMGIKTGARIGRLSETPGPGDYEIRHGDLEQLKGVGHLIGTGKRSNLGVYETSNSLPGMYEGNGRKQAAGPAFSFTQQKKSTKIKKTYDPGPGSYDIPGTVGNMPQYLLTNSGSSIMKTRKSGSQQVF